MSILIHHCHFPQLSFVKIEIVIVTAVDQLDCQRHGMELIELAALRG